MCSSCQLYQTIICHCVYSLLCCSQGAKHTISLTLFKYEGKNTFNGSFFSPLKVLLSQLLINSHEEHEMWVKNLRVERVNYFLLLRPLMKRKDYYVNGIIINWMLHSHGDPDNYWSSVQSINNLLHHSNHVRAGHREWPISDLYKNANIGLTCGFIALVMNPDSFEPDLKQWKVALCFGSWQLVLC